MIDPAAYRQGPLLRLLQTTWPLFTAFGVRVRVSWTIAIWPLLFTIGFVSWMGFGVALLWGAAWTLGLFASVYTHEMGHIWMGRRCGIRAEEMTLRGLGGLAHLDADAQNPEDEIKVAIAGPATHLAWIAVLYPLVWLLEPAAAPPVWWWMLDGFATLQLSLMIFNLTPFYPLDGGRVLRGLLAQRMQANLATLRTAQVGYVGNAAFIVLGLLGWLGIADPFGYDRYGFLLVWIGIEGLRACRNLQLIARHEEVYGPQDPFQKTLRASEAAVREMEREAERAETKARRARERTDARRAELQATVDRLLDRITEAGGVAHLTPRERRELERASRQLSEL